MSQNQSPHADRRQFLQAGAVAATTAAALTAAPGRTTAQDAAPQAAVLPRRKLGNTGAEMTLVNYGTLRVSGLDRLLLNAYERGVRTFDTAAAYRTEPSFKRWFEKKPEVRKEIFLVSKTIARDLDQLVADLDQRLEACGTDHLDLYFWHAMGDHNEPIDFPKSPEFKKAVETIKKSGKARFVGFSTHHPRRAEYIQSAVEGGFIDAIMLQYSPFLEKGSPIDKALDAAHAAGIGLISMKQMAGQFGGARGGPRPPSPVEEATRRLAPMLEERKLTPQQGLLPAIWTDERIAASCVTMGNLDQLRDNTEAARTFTPLKVAELEQLRAASLAASPTFCADCDGRCGRAAGTDARLGDLARYLTYHEHHGHRGEARRQYAELTDAERDWSTADLEAARHACPSRLNFAKLLPEADRLLS
jgi:aryl-alcohol dehydrogenase-like predicted oxidoreductase